MAISIVTLVIVAGALVLIFLLLKMIVTKDYSLLHARGKRTHTDQPRQSFIAPQQRVRGLDLAVAHFVKETPDYKSEAERIEATIDLRNIRESRRRKKPL